MKRLFAVLMIAFALASVSFAQDVTKISASSFGYSEIGPQGEDNFTETRKTGSDGYYALVTFFSDKHVLVTFIEIRNNMLVQSFQEYGKMDYFSKVAENTYRFILNGNRYIQFFYKGDDGNQYFSLRPQDVVSNTIFYFLDTTAEKKTEEGT